MTQGFILLAARGYRTNIRLMTFDSNKYKIPCRVGSRGVCRTISRAGDKTASSALLIQ